MSTASSRRSITSNSLQTLQSENQSLREEILTLKKLFSLPVDENQHSKQFRYQIYSLEKQVALLTRLLDVKREAVATCETILIELIQFLEDIKGKIRRKENLDEKHIQTWIDRIESNRKKSYKSMQDHANLSDTDTIYASNSNKFVKQDPVHLLDICSGKIEHLNLKNIADLESSLSELHADLRSFQSELLDQTNQLIFPDLHQNLVEHSKDLSNKITNTTNDLFYLSILIPTRHQKCSFALEQITTDLICQRINTEFRLAPNIKLYLKTLFNSLICSYNHQISLLKFELNLQTKQLSFFRHTITKIHCQYIQNLMKILSTGQHAFNQQLRTKLYEPLIDILKEFNRMNNEKTDESLKTFLFTFKIHLDQFNEISQDLYQQFFHGSKGVEQLFLQTNEQMSKDIEQQQKHLIEQISQIKTNQSNEQSTFSDDLFKILNIDK